MTRTVKAVPITSRAARAKLAISYQPYFHSLDERLHLGYRKGREGGAWLARWYQGDGKYIRRPVGVADDHTPADGVTALDFAQASKRARELYKASSVPAGPLTVREAVARYVEALGVEKRSDRAGREARASLAKHLPEAILAKPVAALTMADVEAVKGRMVKRGDDPDVLRRSQSNANRVMASFKAALNKAFTDEANQIPTDAAWRRVKGFRGVSAARQVFLDQDQMRRLVNSTEGAFRNFVIAALLTGMRPPHELAGLRVRDLHAAHGVLSLTEGKTGGRDITLTQEAVDFFSGLAVGRDPDDFLLTRDDGMPWIRNFHLRPMREAVKRAKLPEGTTAYTLRHSHASSALLSGMNIKMLAENMGTSILMIEKHYGKFLASSRRAHIAEHGPSLGLGKDDKVVSLRR